MSRLGRRAARVAIRLYPRTWRHRYGAEVLDLVDATDGSLDDAADLAITALRERLTGGIPMRLEPAHRHPRGFALVAALVLAPTLAVVGLSLIGHELGFTAVARVIDPVLIAVGRIRVVDLALVLAPALAFVVAVVPLLDVTLGRADGDGDGHGALTIRIRAVTANLVVALLALLVGATLVWHVVVESVLGAGA